MKKEEIFPLTKIKLFSVLINSNKKQQNTNGLVKPNKM